MDIIILTKADVGCDPRERVWRMTAWIAGGFVFLLAALMVVAHLTAPVHDLVKASALLGAKDILRAAPKDVALQQQVREIDYQTRRSFFLRLARNGWGSWLLLGGSVLFLMATRQLAAVGKKPALTVVIDANADRAGRERARSLAGTGIVGVMALGMLAVAAIVAQAPNLDSAGARKSASGVPPSSVMPGPSESDYRANWPRFRGPDGSGLAVCTNAPTSFNIETGENLLWSTPVPLKGFNSPVVWGNRVFLTGSDKQARELFCFDAENGSLLWRLPVTLVPGPAVEAMNIGELSGLTAPTVATDGERVYAMLTTGELIAADFAGKLVWSKNLGKPDNLYGHASSLVTWRDRVLLQFDQAEAQNGKSKLIAFDGRTGDVVWQQTRPVAASWTTPLLAKVSGREMLLTAGEPWAMAYEPTDGRELWRFGGFGIDLVPSPTLANGLLIAVDAGRQMVAIKPDGRGEITRTHGAWTNLDSAPDITSPVSNGELLFTLGTGGDLACLDTQTGKKLWEHPFQMECQASPTIVGPQLYFFSTEGEMVVVRPAREFAETGRGKLGEPVVASPAVVRDRLYVRGEKHLFCLGQRGGKETVDAP